jgi:predicted PurR-regulated permease PerM
MFILIPGTLFIMFITDQMISLYPTLIKNISSIKDINYYIEKIPFISEFYNKLILNMENFNIKVDIGETLKAIFNYIANFIISQGKSIFINFTLFIIGMIFVIITIFFLFRDGKRLYFFVYEIIPLNVKEKDVLFTKFYNAIMGVVLGIVLTAIFQGILAGIGYYFAGLDYSFFWGFMTFLASFFPIGGTALVWVPIAIYAFFGKGVLTGIFLTIWGTFVISMIDNIVKPIIIGDRTSIHPMVLAFALLGGLNLFGFVGIFLAPIIVVFVENMLILFKEKYLD